MRPYDLLFKAGMLAAIEGLHWSQHCYKNNIQKRLAWQAGHSFQRCLKNEMV